MEVLEGIVFVLFGFLLIYKADALLPILKSLDPEYRKTLSYYNAVLKNPDCVFHDKFLVNLEFSIDKSKEFRYNVPSKKDTYDINFYKSSYLDVLIEDRNHLNDKLISVWEGKTEIKPSKWTRGILYTYDESGVDMSTLNQTNK